MSALWSELAGMLSDPLMQRALVAAGASVHLSNAAAAREAIALIGDRS